MLHNEHSEYRKGAWTRGQESPVVSDEDLPPRMWTPGFMSGFMNGTGG